MRAQPRLLQMLVNYWDPDIEAFILDGMSLKVEVEDIYFIIELSHQGEVLNMRARNTCGGIILISI